AGLVYTEVQGYRDCITIDMGGTSFDAALIKDGRPLLTTEGEVNRMRLELPMRGLVTRGAGWGSIGWIDEGGLLRMGPQSAGAKPGPACYGFGGELPTCTDADLLLGYLDKDFFAGGRMPLYPDRAREAIKKHLSDKLGMDVEATAAGMYDIINVNMAAGVREVSIKRGHDPREFPLVVAGGAGPIHACQIAHELEIPVMIVPRESSIFCASGMLMSDLKHDFVRTYAVPLDEMDRSRFRRLFDEMKAEARALLKSENVPEERVRHSYFLDLRYVKQYHEVSVEISREEVDRADPVAFALKFHLEHNRLYGYSLEKEGTRIELINMRLTSIGLTDKPRLPEQKRDSADSSHALKGRRRMWLPVERRFEQVPVYDGHGLRWGNRLEGPALIEQVNTSTFVTPEFSVVVDRLGSFTIYRKGREEFASRAEESRGVVR
ncbi:MAG: hydantoinase/oxoprolinase family protein, partial [Thermoplasmata archaeon]